MVWKGCSGVVGRVSSCRERGEVSSSGVRNFNGRGWEALLCQLHSSAQDDFLRKLSEPRPGKVPIGCDFHVDLLASPTSNFIRTVDNIH